MLGTSRSQNGRISAYYQVTTMYSQYKLLTNLVLKSKGMLADDATDGEERSPTARMLNSPPPSLDKYPSADSLPILDELLDDIRRPRTTSIASTPTLISSDYENESVLEEGRRSEAELRQMGIADLQNLYDTLEQEVGCVSEVLVRLLRVRDKRVNRKIKQFEKLSSVLKNYAQQSGLGTDLNFSVCPPSSEDLNEHMKWMTAWRVLSRLPKGIPKHWRKTLWSSLAERGTRGLDWNAILQSVFSEYSTPEDETLGSQIVKDLHRTGNTGFTTDEEHAILKRVLLAYARFNKSTGYCQGFNIIAALILKVVDFDEDIALKVMIYLIDYLLPENYFAQNLHALSADMAAFRKVILHYLPELSAHMEELRKDSSGAVKKSYSSENPPDSQSIHAYEPPLVDVFSMQWFLTIFATSLPRKTTRCVWDSVFLEGSEMLVYAGIAILALLERELLQTVSTADFYSTMARLGERLRKAQLLPSTEFMQIVYAVKDCATSPGSTVPDIKQLRETYTYNIYPCPPPDMTSAMKDSIECPHPSRGGSFLFRKKTKPVSLINGDSSKDLRASYVPPDEDADLTKGIHSRNELEDVDLGSFPMEVQVKRLQEHYAQVAKQPPSQITCNLDLAPPRARAVCPQTKVSVYPDSFTSAYAADVPPEVLLQSKMLSGSEALATFQKQRGKVFTISFSQSASGWDYSSEPNMDYSWMSPSKTSRHFLTRRHS